jgi:putative transposase
MGNLKEKLQLSESAVATLQFLVRKGKHAVRKVKRAQILRKLDGGKKQLDLAEAVGVSLSTVYHIPDRYLAGMLAALEDKARPGQPRKVTAELEAALTRMACSQAPEGKARWSVWLINEKIVAFGYALNDESVRLILKKAGLRLG